MNEYACYSHPVTTEGNACLELFMVFIKLQRVNPFIILMVYINKLQGLAPKKKSKGNINVQNQ